MKRRFWPFLAIIYLGACLLLGGSADGASSNGILQGVGLLIILALLWGRRSFVPPEARPLVWIVAAYALYVALTLIPLPYAIWSMFPPRGELARMYATIGVAPGMLPLSLSPQGTMASLLWLIPPAAMFLLVLRLSTEDRRRIPAVIVVGALMSASLGVVQLLGGPQSGLRFYEITNPTMPVGFFANINHQATLLLCAIPCAGFIAARATQRSSRSKRTGGMAFSIAGLVFLVAGVASAGSMAGYGLLIPALVGALLIYRRAVSGPLTRAWKLAVGALLVLVAAGALFGPISQQELAGDLNRHPTSRTVIAENSARAIMDALPLGTGLNTFANVYRRYEDPRRTQVEYVNNAHNDYLEVMLELGVPGALLVLAFILWWARRSLWSWRNESGGANMARAGSVVVGIVLLHSLVDYPIRTAAVAAVFAAACALMVGNVARKDKRAAEQEGGESLRHLEAV